MEDNFLKINKSNLLVENMKELINNHKPKSNLGDLAFISGILEKPNIKQEELKEEIKEEIKKAPEILAEGKNDKIELGTVEIKADVGNLYTVTISNVPGKAQFHANLYTLILKHLEQQLPPFLEANPEIKDLQNYTKSQLAGEAKEAEGAEAGEEGVELGLTPETAEVPTDETSPEVVPTAPTGESATAAAGVPVVELPAI